MYSNNSRNLKPLPPGWEAKFDSGQNRYFYIDHTTKTTSWIHPSDQKPGPSQAKEATGGVYNVKLFNQLRNMFPTAPEWAVKKALLASNNEEKIAVQQLVKEGYHKQGAREQALENNIVSKLQQEFSTADEGIIRDVVQGVNGDESHARRELENLGYKHTPAMVHPRRSLSPTQDTFQSPSRKDLTTPIGGRGSKAATKELSKAEKLKIKQAFCREHPEFPGEEVKMALESCDYDKSKALTLLNFMKMDSKSKSTSSAQSSRSSPARHVNLTSSSTAAATTTSYTTSTYRPAPYNSGTTVSSTDFTLTGFSSSPTRHSTSASTVAKPSTDVTSVNSLLKRQTERSKPVRRVEARRAGSLPTSLYVSSNRTLAVGPNPDLCRGPDMDLISDSYINEKGHNPEMLQPHRSLARGPDRSLLLGSDRSLALGPNPSLVTGSLLRTCAAEHAARSEGSSPVHGRLLQAEL